MRDGVPFDQALERTLTHLPDADRRLAHELAAGALRSASALDRSLAPFVTRGWDRVPPDIRELLRLGAYQLTGLDRVPPHAAVSTAVALAREARGAATAGFVNAVLRKVAELAPRLVPGRGSHPGWLVSRWSARFGPTATGALLEWNDTPPSITVQPARWTLDQLMEAWRTARIPFGLAPFGAGLVPGTTRPRDLPGYDQGAFIVQDPAQALVIRAFDLPGGLTVYDACAAPGGKTIALGLTAARVIAAEGRRPRIRRLRENLRRAGSGREHVILADALHPPIRPVDAVVLDVPCSGTGVLARHPEARWRVHAEAIPELAANAGRMLARAAEVVRPGGWLCFSTCSLEPEENDVQIEAFLAAHPDFQREPPAAMPDGVLTPAGDLALLPHVHGTDGAYAARLRRRPG